LFTAYRAAAPTEDYLSAWIDTSGRVNLASVSANGAGSAGSVQLAGDKANNVIHEAVVSWEKNALRLWVDGVAATPDSAFDSPVGMDTLDLGADVAAANQLGPGIIADYQVVPYAVLAPIPAPSGFLV
jgi:hypothetical protein